MPELCEGGAAVPFIDGILIMGGSGRCCLKYMPEDDVFVQHSRPNKVHAPSTAFSFNGRVLLNSQTEGEQYDPEMDEWSPSKVSISGRNSDTHHSMSLFSILK